MNDNDIVKNITIEVGEECKVEVELLHEALLHLPMIKYLQLYKYMTMAINKHLK